MKEKYIIITGVVVVILCIGRVAYGQVDNTWLTLNEDMRYPSGVYTPSHFRADGEIRQGLYDYGSYGIQTAGAMYTDDYLIAEGGIHIGSAADPGTDNLIVDGKVAVGKTMPWHTLDVDGDIACEQVAVNCSNPGSWELYVDGEVYVSDELKVDDFICTPGGLHVGGTSDPGSDNLVVDGRLGVGTSYPSEALHVDGQVYISSMNSTSSGFPVRYYNNRLYYETSSARYKDAIHVLETDFLKILQVKSYKYIDKTSNLEEIGFIAEALDSLGLPQLVVYGAHGPESVRYDRVSMYLLEVVKTQQAMIQQLNYINDDLVKRVEALEQAVSVLR